VPAHLALLSNSPARWRWCWKKLLAYEGSQQREQEQRLRVKLTLEMASNQDLTAKLLAIGGPVQPLITVRFVRVGATPRRRVPCGLGRHLRAHRAAEYAPLTPGGAADHNRPHRRRMRTAGTGTVAAPRRNCSPAVDFAQALAGRPLAEAPGPDLGGASRPGCAACRWGRARRSSGLVFQPGTLRYRPEHD
jgi:hypothetical protein